MESYSAELARKLDVNLRNLLEECRAPADIAQWLADKGIMQVGAFSDLADSKDQIVKVLHDAGAPVDAADALKCQPIKTAFRRALAMTKAEDEARAKGEDIDREATLSSDDKKRLDKNTADHFKFQWPQTLLMDDATMGRLVKMVMKKTRYVPRLGEIRNPMEKGPEHAGKILLEISMRSGSIKGRHGTPEEVAIGGLIQFCRRHLMLMIGYAQAAGPDWEKASLTTLLDYHEWVMEKAYEGPRTREKLCRLIEADLQMRTKWTLAYSREEFQSLTAAIQHHRSESAYLFQDINKPPTSRGEEQERGEQRRQHSERDDTSSTQMRSKGRSRSRDRRPAAAEKPFALQTHTAQGAEICIYYNKAAGCKNSRCRHEHICNYPGCKQRHPRSEHHPTQPLKQR